jgi:fructose-bisphosphate aldolase class I
VNAQMHEKMATGDGFIAALDQSGGSTPGALAAYGVPEDAYGTDEEMFDLVHQMRTRIITSPSFTGDKILGAILFEGTMDRDVEGVPTPTYLWQTKGVVPFVKVDKGKEAEADGVELMKPMPGLDDLLARARDKGVYGTKMRSVVNHADATGVKAIVDQQFEVGQRILDAGLMPILEPEVDIHAPDKEQAEEQLREHIAAHLDAMSGDHQVMLKLSIPTRDGFYTPLIDHPNVLRVVALSGGYSREEANERLARNPGLIASFSRALIGELSAKQSDEEFDATLATAVDSIYAASTT